MDHPLPFPGSGDAFNSAPGAPRPAVAISACLHGEPVRYDATAKLLPTLPLLRAALDLIPLCPEFEAGLGLPRPPVQLVAAEPGMQNIRVVGRDDPRLDVTATLSRHAETQAHALANREPPLCGYILKSRSPSCGAGSTPLWGHRKGEAALVQLGERDGLQAAAVRQTLPWLVMVEESELTTAAEVARFVVACRGVALALDCSVDLMTLTERCVGGDAPSIEVTERLAEFASSGDRQRYARALGTALMTKRMG